jgi:polyisoprenyl-teichoic acid--peptidoglycan teichoic acid transferase
MIRYTGLAVLLLALLLLPACFRTQPDAVETQPPRSRFYRHPAGFSSPTPFQPNTYTPLPPPPHPTASPTFTPASTETATAAPVPTATPTPDWNLVNWPQPTTTSATAIPTPFDHLSNGHIVNFLLIGSDLRGSSAFRTDTLIIASVRTQDNSVSLISIPRDLFVYIPGWTMNRINTAYFYGERSKYPGGGKALLKDTILYNLGVHIDNIAMVEFDGFRTSIDTLGGIEVPMACAFTDWRLIDPQQSDQDPDNWELYTVGPGLIQMDGDLALWYARSRLRSSDYDRGRRQQEIIRSVFTRVANINLIPRLPALYMQLKDSVQTDLSLEGMLQMAPMLRHLEAPRLRSFYITNKMVMGWRTPGGASVLLPDGPAIQVMLEEAFSTPKAEVHERLELNVEIWNGTTNPDWDTLAAERLHYAGFQTAINPSDHRGYEHSRLVDFSSGGDPIQSAALLKVLGLPASSLHQVEGENGSFAYRLVLGADYNPCFNPTR